MTDHVARIIRTKHLEMIGYGKIQVVLRRRRSDREDSMIFGIFGHPATFFRLPEAWLPEYEDILDQVMDDQLLQMKEGT